MPVNCFSFAARLSVVRACKVFDISGGKLLLGDKIKCRIYLHQ